MEIGNSDSQNRLVDIPDTAIDSGQMSNNPSGYTLDELLAGVTDENRHDEIDTGHFVGNEISN